MRQDGIVELSYDEFFDDYSRIIFKFIHSFSSSKHLKVNRYDVDDIYQEIAMKIIRNDYLSKYNSEKSSFLTWLNIICRTMTIDYYRRKMRWETGEWSDEPEESTDLGAEQPVFTLPSGVLTDRQEEVIVLLFKDDMEAGEIAAKLGISPMTVRSIKFQALERLRRHFKTAARSSTDQSTDQGAKETRRKVS
jgi:RNA polymerase sigma-70 factor (ECF subfamily)